MHICENNDNIQIEGHDNKVVKPEVYMHVYVYVYMGMCGCVCVYFYICRYI
jgi:hypothetical protein